MLIRINQIQSIGCFKSTRAANLQFEQLTFIYGDNSFGKSTLCDIFQSLSENQVSYLSKRKSIPNPNNEPQRVNISFRLPNSTTETPIIFSNGNWSPSIGDIKIYVFDTDFIHRNVFTGLTIERKNQENITQFVLGEDSVESARQIASNNSFLRTINKELRSIESNEFQGIYNLPSFIALEITLSEQQIIETITSVEREIVTKRNLLNNLDSLINRVEPENIQNNLDYGAFVSRLNACFNSSYERIHENASEIVINHINNNCNPESQNQSWLRQGLNVLVSENCPFCSQKLELDAQELISAYREYFDEAFNLFESEMRNELNNFHRENRIFYLFDTKEIINRNNVIIQEYIALINTQEYLNAVQNLSTNAQHICTLIDSWHHNFANIEETLHSKIQSKLSSLFRNIGDIDLTQHILQFNAISDTITSYNNELDIVLELIANYKISLNAELIRNEIQVLEESQEGNKISLKRLQLNPICERYTQLLRERDTTTESNSELEANLETSQDTYLNEYFERINQLFTRLGSESFQITKSISRRGNMPVVILSATYCGVPITNEQVSCFFSESDRRALALSVFLAKIISLTDEQKHNAIILLDDPITSFDDSRIERTIRLMETERPAYRQVIILSHYPKYIKSFFERANTNTTDIKLLRLTKNAITTNFDIAQPFEFVETLHQRKFRKIIGFIERTHTEDISLELRVFFEEEVKMRYKKQIEDNALSNLSFIHILDGLRLANAISEANRNAIEQFRLTLNVDHHIWSERTQDEIIGIANDLINYIYTEL